MPTGRRGQTSHMSVTQLTNRDGSPTEEGFIYSCYRAESESVSVKSELKLISLRMEGLDVDSALVDDARMSKDMKIKTSDICSLC